MCSDLWLICLFCSICVPDISMMVRVFINGPEELGSIPGRVIPKTQKCYLLLSCLTLSIIRYRPRVKWSNPGKGVEPFSAPWFSSYRKGGLRVTLDYGRQLYFILSIVIFRLSLLAWRIFLCQIPSLYPDCVFLSFLLRYPILFNSWQTVWYCPRTLGGCDFLTL